MLNIKFANAKMRSIFSGIERPLFPAARWAAFLRVFFSFMVLLICAFVQLTGDVTAKERGFRGYLTLSYTSPCYNLSEI